MIFQQEAFTHLSLCLCNCKATGAFFLPWAPCWKPASSVPLVESYCAAVASMQTPAHTDGLAPEHTSLPGSPRGCVGLIGCSGEHVTTAERISARHLLTSARWWNEEKNPVCWVDSVIQLVIIKALYKKNPIKASICPSLIINNI